MCTQLLSLKMPSYNCGQYVEDTIRSVQAQTYQNWEIIFIDDCSTDDTIKRVSALKDNDARIRLFTNKSNLGAAISRNNALREARGKWIAFLDSDDIWEPKKLEKQIQFMKENGYLFSYTCYQEIDVESKLTGIVISGPAHITEHTMRLFCWPGCLTVMFNREAIGLFQIKDIKKNNDYAMWLKVCKKADCYLLPEVLAEYRRGRSGSISTHSIKTMIGWHYKLWHEVEGYSVLSALWFTGMNLLFGVYKKVHYVKKNIVATEVC